MQMNLLRINSFLMMMILLEVLLSIIESKSTEFASLVANLLPTGCQHVGRDKMELTKCEKPNMCSTMLTRQNVEKPFDHHHHSKPQPSGGRRQVVAQNMSTCEPYYVKARASN